MGLYRPLVAEGVITTLFHARLVSKLAFSHVASVVPQSHLITCEAENNQSELGLILGLIND